VLSTENRLLGVRVSTTCTRALDICSVYGIREMAPSPTRP